MPLSEGEIAEQFKIAINHLEFIGDLRIINIPPEFRDIDAKNRRVIDMRTGDTAKITNSELSVAYTSGKERIEGDLTRQDESKNLYTPVAAFAKAINTGFERSLVDGDSLEIAYQNNLALYANATDKQRAHIKHMGRIFDIDPDATRPNDKKKGEFNLLMFLVSITTYVRYKP